MEGARVEGVEDGTASHVGTAVPTDGPAARFGKSLAVVIGIDMYGEGIAPLRSAVADADAIGEVLERDHGFETWRLFDEGARLPALLALLDQELPAALGPDDRLVFYFAGHGIAVDGDGGPAGSLVPAGARAADPQGFLPMQRLHEALARLPVRHALVVLDCCFAGSFRWSSLRDAEPLTPIYRERYDRYLERPAWQVLTSTSEGELALDALAGDALAQGRGEGGGSHSPFARALLEGLAGAADYTGDHVMTADELAIFVRDRVAPAAEDAGHRQLPQLFPLDRHDGGQFLFGVPNRTPRLLPAPRLDEAANPYRGLRAYDEANRALFFGRDAAVAQLAAAATARPLTVLVGPSGSGKSSLVFAGLVPALRDRGFRIAAVPHPGRDPRGAAAALAAEPGADGGPRLVVIDHLEELLGPDVDPGDRAALLGAIERSSARALRGDPSLRVVLVTRSDAEPELRHGALARRWEGARLPIPAMTRDELRQVIERPAAAAVVHFEPARLVDRLLDEVALVPLPLPLLSVALSELYLACWKRWQAGDRDRAIREADHDARGGIAGALIRRATALHDELAAEEPAYATTVRNVFRRMVAMVGGKVVRRKVPAFELVYSSPAENWRVAEVLRRFERARLISRGLDRTASGRINPYVEPVHDELVHGWELAARWLHELDATPGRRALVDALGSAVCFWRARKLDPAYLWNDPRVEDAKRIGRGRTFALNAHEELFLRRSGRLRRGRDRRLVGVLVAAVAVLGLTSGVALWEWWCIAGRPQPQLRCEPHERDAPEPDEREPDEPEPEP